MEYYSRKPSKPSKSRKIFWLLPLFVIVAAGAWYFAGSRAAESPPPASEQEQAATEQKPQYQPVDLQPVVQQWAKDQRADYHIMVYDAQADQNIAEYQPGTSLFAASLYKIYVAYLSLKDFQSGAQDPSEILVAGQTKKQCVDKMIRSSDSPCGEAMMAEIGQSTLNQRVKDELGTTGTFFNGIRTSAADSIQVLKFIHAKKGLTDEDSAFLLDAMLTQDAKFKRGLATGAPEARWETKVGWNEDANYHDIGIMTMPDGRKFAVAILGQGSGSSAPIADFAKTVYDALTL